MHTCVTTLVINIIIVLNTKYPFQIYQNVIQNINYMIPS